MARPSLWNRPIPFTPSMAAIVRFLEVFVVGGVTLLIAAFPTIGLARGWFVPMSKTMGLGSAGPFLVLAYNAVLLAAMAVVIRTRPRESRFTYLGPVLGAFFVTQALAMDPVRFASSDDYRAIFWTRLVFGSLCAVLFLAFTIVGLVARRRAAGPPAPSTPAAE